MITQLSQRIWSILRIPVYWFDSWQPKHPNPNQDPYRVDWVQAVPFITMHLMCLGVFWVGLSWPAVLVALFLYGLRMFAITGFYHRYFSHRTFKTSRVCQFLFGLAGAVIAVGSTDGPAVLVLWAGVALAVLGGVSLLARGIAQIDGAERAIARAEGIADAERLEHLDRQLAEVLEPIVRQYLDSLTLTFDSMARGESVEAGGWPRALDRFYEGVVVPRALDALPEEPFRSVLAACAPESPADEPPSIADAAFKARAVAWIERYVRSSARQVADSRSPARVP